MYSIIGVLNIALYALIGKIASIPEVRLALGEIRGSFVPVRNASNS